MTPDLLLAYDPERIRPGWVALLIVVALGVATFLLWRSMNSQLRRIDVPKKNRDEAAADPEEGQDAEPPADPADAAPKGEASSSADVNDNHPS